MATSQSLAPPVLVEGLARAVQRIGLPPPEQLEQLSGGANMESWRFRAGSETCILRRAPTVEMMHGRPLDHAAEVAVIGAARRAGVLAPEVLGLLQPQDGLGSGYLMRALPGTADPAQILATADGTVLIRAIAAQLAAVHAADCAGVPVPVMNTSQAVGELRSRFIAYGGNRPILALALRWLEQNLPLPVPLRLLHGDFRLGNLLVQDSRLTGVLDWELAHRGDPMEDLAFGCMAVWRFARVDRPAYGLATIADLAQAYEAAGGEPFDLARFRFWTIYRTLWWALGCLQMGDYWRAGHDRGVERVVVARRTCEQELDLLLLLEEQAPADQRAAPLPPSPPLAEVAAGEPSAAEILTAVSEWLARDIKPLLAGRDRFNLAVARNALGIAARNNGGALHHDAELAAAILTGQADLTTPGLLGRLRRTALEKVAADMPKYPNLPVARALWERG